jgi:virulence-associated protein VagC
MTTQIFQSDNGQAVRLPVGFEFADKEVTIRREGNAVVLEPMKAKTWPEGFFEQIRIDDPKFQRPPQGLTPPAPELKNGR